MHKLRTLAGLILIVWIMLTLYTRSSPLLGGYSFSEAIPRSAFGMADLVGVTTQQQMLAKLDQIIDGVSSMSSFSFFHARDFIIYIIITALIAVFMDTQLANNILAAWTKDKSIDKFLSDSWRRKHAESNCQQSQ